MGEGVVYFPYIEVPQSGWLLRALLYWDQVATIVPRRMAYRADFSEFTAKLLRVELLRTVPPEDAVADLERPFLSYLENLPGREVRKRQRAYRKGATTRIHGDKLLWAQPFPYVAELGLAASPDRATREHGDTWIPMERSTAFEFMAAMALAISHPASPLRRHSPHQWVPATDRPHALLSLVGGSAGFADDEARLHGAEAEAEDTVGPVRALVLSKLFPVPENDFFPDVDDLLRFKRRHGARLRAFRERVETEVDALVEASDDPGKQARRLRRLTRELEGEIAEVERVMESGFVGRTVRSGWCRLAAKFDPTKAASLAVEAAGLAVGAEGRHGPLAYAAFADVGLLRQPPGVYEAPIAALPQHPLIAAFGANAPEPRRHPLR